MNSSSYLWDLAPSHVPSRKTNPIGWIDISVVRLLLLVLAMAGSASRLVALDPNQVFDAVSPSTVFIEDVDSFGSGVFLNETGLILTNYHVVAANISLKVRARVRFGNRVVLTELDEVKVTKIHKEYDLALLEVKAPQNGAFIPARMLPATPPLSTGVKCYAIGNPGGPDGKSLELSITEGLVGAALRKVEDLEYVQISAQINPGNSGGPVCDDQGRVIGIATWKMTETEGIGFAIPTQKLNMADFIDLKERKSNFALAHKAEEAAVRYHALARAAEGRTRQILLLECAEAYRVTMLAVPNDVIPYNNLAASYSELGIPELAKKYVEAGLRIDPNNPNGCHLLGTFLMAPNKQDQQMASKCMEIWFRGFESNGEKEARGFCGEDIATTMIRQGNLPAGAYALQWTETLSSGSEDTGGKEHRIKLWTSLEQKMPPADLRAIRAKTSGFLKTDFYALATGKPLISVVPYVAATTIPANSIPTVAGKASFASSTGAPGITEEQMAKLVKDAAARFSATQVAVPPQGLVCKLPSEAGEAMLAYGGWQAVIRFPEMSQFGVFNLATGQLEGMIGHPNPGFGSFLFTVGGQVLALYTGTTHTVELYDLATRKRFASKTLSADEPVKFMSMGLLNPSRVFVIQYVPHKGRQASYRASFLRVPDFSATEFPLDEYPVAKMEGELNFTTGGGMDETGVLAAIGGYSRDGDIREGLAVLAPRSGNKIDLKIREDKFGSVGVAQGAKFIVGELGLFDLATDSAVVPPILGAAEPQRFVPVAGYPGFLSMESNGESVGIRVLSLPAMKNVARFSVAESVREFVHPDYLRFHHGFALMASAYCDRIVYVFHGSEKKEMILFPLGLKDGAVQPGDAEPGKRFQKKLGIAAGSTVTVQSGPPGLKYDAADGTLVWDVPADIKTGQYVSVIMVVKDADAKENYLVEKIFIP